MTPMMGTWGYRDGWPIVRTIYITRFSLRISHGTTPVESLGRISRRMDGLWSARFTLLGFPPGLPMGQPPWNL